MCPSVHVPYPDTHSANAWAPKRRCHKAQAKKNGSAPYAGMIRIRLLESSRGHQRDLSQLPLTPLGIA
jgi:hypothetical protein